MKAQGLRSRLQRIQLFHTAASLPCREMPAAQFSRLGPSELSALFAAQQPLVIRGYAESWPAATEWRDFDRLAARAQGELLEKKHKEISYGYEGPPSQDNNSSGTSSHHQATVV